MHPDEYVLVEVVVGFAQIWRGVTRGASSMIRHCRRLEWPAVAYHAAMESPPVPLRVLCTQRRRRSNSHSQLAASRAFEAGVRKEVGSQMGEIAVTSRRSNVFPSVLHGGGRDILEQTLYPETLTAGDEIRSGRVWSLAGRDDPPPVDRSLGIFPTFEWLIILATAILRDFTSHVGSREPKPQYLVMLKARTYADYPIELHFLQGDQGDL